MKTFACASDTQLVNHTLTSLPIVVLHVHSRCNCRCTMCDIWQSKETNELSSSQLQALLTSFRRLSVRWVVLTGGEPLLHRDLHSLCGPLQESGIKITLLTTGLLLSKYAGIASSLFDEIIVSIDGPPVIHDQIRRVSRGFNRIATGLKVVHEHAPSIPLRARCTVQKANHDHIRETVMVAKTLPLQSISFLAADLTSEAFNRKLLWPVARQNEVALTASEIDVLEREIETLIEEYDTEIREGFIAEAPHKLRRIVQHFLSHLGKASAQAPQCNAPWTSTVIELDGRVRPCFFHRPVGTTEHGLDAAINGPAAKEFRKKLDVATNPICRRCVCSLNYREA